ncbi:MAG: CDP-glycerol glycerophosphotransferase family protein [Nocardioides sp.]
MRRGLRSTLRPGRVPSDEPLVTVVVTVGSASSAHLDEGLYAVRDQTHRHLEILVAPVLGAERDLDGVRAHAVDDMRFRVLRVAPDRATARNRGAAAARGEFLVFADATDVLPPHAVAALLMPVERTGSDLVIGRRTEVRTLGRTVVQPPDPLHDEPRNQVTLETCPVAVTDLGAENRLYRRSFWTSAGLAFGPGDRNGAELALDATARARRFDVVKDVTYLAMNRAVAAPVGQLPDHMEGLDDWLADQQDKRGKVSALGIAELRDQWAYAALDTWVQPLLDDIERAADEQWVSLRQYVDELDAEMSPEVWDRLRAESRVKLWLLRNDRRDQLAEFLSRRWFEQGNRATEVVDGEVRAELPFYGDPEVGIPPETFVMQPAETPLVTVLREAAWGSAHQLDLVLFTWIDFVAHGGVPEVDVSLVQDGTGARFTPAVEQYDTVQVTHFAGHRYQDYRHGGVSVSIDTEALAAVDGAVGQWHLELVVRYRGLERRGGVTRKDFRGSADLVGSRHLAPRRVADTLVGLAATPESLLSVTVDLAPPVRLVGPSVTGRTIAGTLASDPGVQLAALRLTGPDGQKATVPLGADASFSADLPRPQRGEPGRHWELEAVDAAGSRQQVLWPDATPEPMLGHGSGSVVWARSETGASQLVEAAGVLLVERLTLGAGHLEVDVRWLGKAPKTYRLELCGTRVRLEAAPVEGAPDTTLRFALTWDEWGFGPRPVPLERYSFELSYGPQGNPGRVLYGTEVLASSLEFQLDPDYLMRPFSGRDDLGVVLARPLDENERGPFHQKQLQQWCLSGELPLDDDAVYFQSYAGASATDSQLAIHHELRRSHPHLKLYWGVADRSSTVPEGGIPVLIYSRAWYRALAESAYLVNNIDFDRWFRKRPGQRMLQTFHGYPSKSMGIRLWTAKQFSPKRIEAELARTSAGWDIALTPTPEMDEHYRREYRYDGEIFSHGYPRDDVLVSPDADRIRKETRERLGIRPGQTAVLYAPTWRDDLATNYRSAQMAKHLDVESASRALGDDFVMLMRGHRFHARAGHHEGRSTRMIDVTTYPEINDLILAADVAVLDYSSLRFDFALTGRPMLFLVPDLATYTGAVRGFLFDFASSAPGPLLNRADEVVESLRDLERISAKYAGARDAFHARFNYLQDGHSAEQVVAKFFGPAQ